MKIVNKFIQRMERKKKEKEAAEKEYWDSYRDFLLSVMSYKKLCDQANKNYKKDDKIQQQVNDMDQDEINL